MRGHLTGRIKNVPIIPSGFVHVAHHLRYVSDPEDMIVTYAVSRPEGSIGDLTALANALHGAFQTAWGGQLNSGYTHPRVTVRLGIDGAPDIVAESNTAIGNFTGSSAVLPSNCALMVKKITGQGGRRNKGRMYIPGYAEGVVDGNGFLNGADVTSLRTVVQNWRTAIAGLADVGEVVLLHSLVGQAPTVVTNFDIDPRIATMRRRMRR